MVLAYQEHLVPLALKVKLDYEDYQDHLWLVFYTFLMLQLFKRPCIRVVYYGGIKDTTTHGFI